MFISPTLCAFSIAVVSTPLCIPGHPAINFYDGIQKLIRPCVIVDWVIAILIIASSKLLSNPN